MKPGQDFMYKTMLPQDNDIDYVVVKLYKIQFTYVHVMFMCCYYKNKYLKL